MKATKATVEFHESLPSPNALRSLAEDIQINQNGTRIHKEILASLTEVKSNLEKNILFSDLTMRKLSTQNNLPGTINFR